MYQITITKREEVDEQKELCMGKMGITRPGEDQVIFTAKQIHADDAVALLQHLHDLDSKKYRI